MAAPLDPIFQKAFDALSSEEQAAVLAARDSDQEKRDNLAGASATLRQWAADARGTTVTSGNAVQVLQQIVNRLGTFFDRFADLLDTRRQ